MQTPKGHSNYWRDLAQRRLVVISRLRDGLSACRKKATVRGQPNSGGHFGIAGIAQTALREAEHPKHTHRMVTTVATAINGGSYFTSKPLKRIRYSEARAVLRAI